MATPLYNRSNMGLQRQRMMGGLARAAADANAGAVAPMAQPMGAGLNARRGQAATAPGLANKTAQMDMARRQIGLEERRVADDSLRDWAGLAAQMSRDDFAREIGRRNAGLDERRFGLDTQRMGLNQMNENRTFGLQRQRLKDDQDATERRFGLDERRLQQAEDMELNRRTDDQYARGQAARAAGLRMGDAYDPVAAAEFMQTGNAKGLQRQPQVRGLKRQAPTKTAGYYEPMLPKRGYDIGGWTDQKTGKTTQARQAFMEAMDVLRADNPDWDDNTLIDATAQHVGMGRREGWDQAGYDWAQQNLEGPNAAKARAVLEAMGAM